MNLAETLRRAADEEQLQLHPLPTHALSDKDEHVRQHYALVLTATLSAQESVSDSQSRLLLLLLNSLGLGDQRAALFGQVRDWEQTQLSESLRLLREEDATRELVIDALVLLRLDAPLSEPISGLIADMAAFFGFDQSTLAELADVAASVLGIEAEGEILAENWPNRYPRRLTAESLTKGMHGGLWLVEEPLSINVPWSAHNAVLVFRQGASIQTTWSGNGELSLTGCQCMNAVLTYTGAGIVSVHNCLFSGTYDASLGASALECDGTELVVRNSEFSTTNARALACKEGDLTVSESRFTACGFPEALGGAIFHSEKQQRRRWFAQQQKQLKVIITNSYFDRCIALRGGAIYTRYLGEVEHCEFIACQSLGLELAGGKDVAVYCAEEALQTPAVSECILHDSSVYIASLYYAIDQTFVKNSIFNNGSIYFSAQSTDNKIASNCTFAGGSIVQKKFD